MRPLPTPIEPHLALPHAFHPPAHPTTAHLAPPPFFSPPIPLQRTRPTSPHPTSTPHPPHPHPPPTPTHSPQFFLDLTSPDFRTPEAEETTRDRIGQLAALYTAEKGGYVPPSDISKARIEDMRIMNEQPGFKNNIFKEFGLLLRRAWLQNSRDRMTPVFTLVQTMIIGFVLAALYSDIPISLTGVQDTIGEWARVRGGGALAACLPAAWAARGGGLMPALRPGARLDH